MHYCSLWMLFLAVSPNGGPVGAQFRAIMPQVLASFHKLFIMRNTMFSFYNSCFCVFTQSASHSFPPQTVFRRVKSISAVISVMSCCVVCMCVSVMRRSFISSFISRPAPSSPVSRCLFSFFPYFHTLGHTCSCALSLSFKHTLTQALQHTEMTELLHKHLCKQVSGIQPLAQVYKERHWLLILWLTYC